MFHKLTLFHFFKKYFILQTDFCTVMSDEELDLSESSEGGGDFSASEDDWVPENEKHSKKSRVASSSSDDDDDDDFEESPVKTAVKTTTKRATFVVPKTFKLTGTAKTIAKKMKLTNAEDSDSSDESTETSKAITKKVKLPNADDSDSSGDDYMVDPNNIDLNSDFFAPSTSKASATEQPPTFECNIGMNLSDSEEESDANETENEAVASALNFNTHEKFNRNLDAAKIYLSNFDAKDYGKDDNSLFDVTKLLAMGESSSSKSTEAIVTNKKRKKRSADSDSDFEEVAENKIEDVVITVGPTIKPKVDRTQLELEASIKRKINRRKKEIQLGVHKVHLLCWIAHGNYVNQILNATKLMEMCLKFMPSKKCYPDGRTDIDYFQQIMKWYQSQMKLSHDKMYSSLTKLPPLAVSLALQIKTQSAICKKDYVLIFVILLRAIGIQCRVVMNLVTAPIRPPSDDLCSISLKSDAKKKEKTVAKKKTTEKAPEKKKKVSEIKNENSKKTSQIKDENSKKASEIKIDNSKKTSQIKNETSKYPPTKKLSLRKESIQKLKSDAENKVEEKNISPSNENTKDYVIKKEETENKINLSKVAAKNEKSQVKLRVKTLSANSSPVVTQQTSSTPPKNNESPHFQKVPNLNVVSSPISRRTRATHKKNNNSQENVQKVALSKLKKPSQLDGADDLPKKSKPNLVKLKEAKKTMKKSRKHTSSDDSDFCSSPKKKLKIPLQNKTIANIKETNKRLDNRLLSTDNEDDSKPQKKKSMDIWVEVYAETEEKWMCLDLFKLKIHCVDVIRVHFFFLITREFYFNCVF